MLRLEEGKIDQLRQVKVTMSMNDELATLVYMENTSVK